LDSMRLVLENCLKFNYKRRRALQNQQVLEAGAAVGELFWQLWQGFQPQLQAALEAAPLAAAAQQLRKRKPAGDQHPQQPTPLRLRAERSLLPKPRPEAASGSVVAVREGAAGSRVAPPVKEADAQEQEAVLLASGACDALAPPVPAAAARQKQKNMAPPSARLRLQRSRDEPKSSLVGEGGRYRGLHVMPMDEARELLVQAACMPAAWQAMFVERAVPFLPPGTTELEEITEDLCDMRVWAALAQAVADYEQACRGKQRIPEDLLYHRKLKEHCMASLKIAHLCERLGESDKVQEQWEKIKYILANAAAPAAGGAQAEEDPSLPAADAGGALRQRSDSSTSDDSDDDSSESDDASSEEEEQAGMMGGRPVAAALLMSAGWAPLHDAAAAAHRMGQQQHRMGQQQQQQMQVEEEVDGDDELQEVDWAEFVWQ